MMDKHYNYLQGMTAAEDDTLSLSAGFIAARFDWHIRSEKNTACAVMHRTPIQYVSLHVTSKTEQILFTNDKMIYKWQQQAQCY